MLTIIPAEINLVDRRFGSSRQPKVVHMKCRFLVVVAVGFSSIFPLPRVDAQQPTSRQALSLKPVQDGVPYDVPTAKEIGQCTMRAGKGENGTGWLVVGPGGETLRKFLDTNADNKVDLWCYFEKGIETYRDIDGDRDGTADQYRWLGGAGSRWGLDPNQDGSIDTWKVISPQELTYEVVAAFREGDAARLQALFPSAAELESLPVGSSLKTRILEHVRHSQELLPKIVKEQKIVGKKAEWVNFGATWPGTLAASEHGGSDDLIAYENVLAIIDGGENHHQVPVGTLIQVGTAWRLVSAPLAQSVVKDETAGSPLLFHIARVENVAGGPEASAGISAEMQALVAKLETLDEKLNRAESSDGIGSLHEERARVLSQIVEASSAEERPVWIRQLLDTISASVQSGAFPEGISLLEKLAEELVAQKAEDALCAHARWLAMSAQYAAELEKTDDFAKVQTAWQETLEKFVTDYPATEDSSEVMLQLAMAKEFVGEDDKAEEWYTKIRENFKDKPVAEKATGAVRRLKQVGQPLKLTGKLLDGKAIDTGKLVGKWVLLHYWASWCDPCKRDIEALAPIYAAHKSDFVPIGICLDTSASEAAATVIQLKMTWPQIHESGGLDGRLAKEFGVFTLPVMVLIDPKGNVTHRTIHVRELEAELQKRIARK